MNYKQLPRQNLGYFPTPLIHLKNLSVKLSGPRILMKRDDHTGLAMGGNKTRKLEFLIGEAITMGCDTLITGGAEQSNHCRQTAAAAAACGLKCHLVLGGEAPDIPGGNLLLNDLFGAEIHWAGDFRKGEKIPEIAENIKHSGYKPCIIPYGGSNPIGATAFVEAVNELLKQVNRSGDKIDHVIFPTSSGGTQAGLVIGKYIFKQQFNLIGIGIDKDAADEIPFNEHVLHLANATAKHLDVDKTFKTEDIIIRNEYQGLGYGIVGELERKAIRLVAQTEGILLDPVYSGRAMGAMIDMIENNEFSPEDTVLFWHTGGTPAIFPYAADILG